MKIIIYALGKIFELYKEQIAWEQVVAVADKKSDILQEMRGRPVISPHTLHEWNYDYIAVFSDKWFEEIKVELAGEYFVPPDKIIPWRELVETQIDAILDEVQFYKNYCKARGFKKILDAGEAVLATECWTKEAFTDSNTVQLDGLLRGKKGCNAYIYDHVYGCCADCEDGYDAAILWELTKDTLEDLEALTERSRFILFCTRYFVDGKPAASEIPERLKKYGKCSYISTVEGLYWILEPEDHTQLEDISIYVVTHKEYNLRSDQLYIPLCVGNFRREGWLTEHVGENIAHLNQKLNECTALFWIWKNTNSKYVGLNHYRRYFYNDEIRSMDNYLNARRINEYLENYDIILTKAHSLGGKNVYRQLEHAIDSELFHKAYRLLRGKLQKNQPDYLDAFDNVMESHCIFICNMFVTRREILNSYCEWLFSFLIEAAEEIDVNGYDSYSQRVMGFFAERMWTVWLRENRLKIKELPYVTVR